MDFPVGRDQRGIVEADQRFEGTAEETMSPTQLAVPAREPKKLFLTRFLFSGRVLPTPRFFARVLTVVVVVTATDYRLVVTRN